MHTAAAVTADESPQSRLLFVQAERVDADQRRHDEAARPERRCHGDWHYCNRWPVRLSQAG
jgi:hypothetical protein